MTNQRGTKFLTLALGLVLASMTKPGEGEAPLTPEQIAAKIESTVRTILAEHGGDAKVALGAIVQENYREREKVRSWKEKHDALEGKQPKDGMVVLSVEEAAQWEAYKKLGKPDEVVKKIEEGTKAADLIAQGEKAKTIADVAKSMNWNPEVLQQLVTFGNLTIESTKVSHQGQDIWAHNVKTADGKTTGLEEFAKSNWATFAPSLEAKGTDGGGGTGSSGGEGGTGTETGGGFQWPSQGGGGGGTGGGDKKTGVDKVVTELLDSRANTPSPFEPKK